MPASPPLAWADRLDDLVTAQRVRVYAVLLVVAYALGLIGLAASIRGGLDSQGNPPGADFIIFYAASSLALKGHAVAAWSGPALLAAERAVVPASRGLFLWCYPPPFMLAVQPLARLPYGAALAAWTGAGLVAYLTMIRLIVRDRRALGLALAFPGVFVTMSQGQNGFFSAAVLGTGLLLLDRRPWLAGATLGLIACKPHFGLLLPLLLIGTGRWRSALATGLAAGALIALSTAAYGVDAWQAFLATAPSVGRALESGALPLAKVPSVFAAARLLGAPTVAAYALQAGAAAAAALLALWAWRRPGPLPLKAGLAVTATLIASPYAFDYDLVMLAVPISALAAHGLRERLPSGARAVLVVAAAAPLIGPALARYAHLPLVPLALAALFAINLRALVPATAVEAPVAVTA